MKKHHIDADWPQGYSDTKPNLVMIQAFPANKTNSRGVIEFMSQYFNFHFIELPGFGPEHPAIKVNHIEDYLPYVQQQIDELALDSYILSGLSFGYLLASLLPKSDKCTRVIALEPFCGHKFLHMSWLKKRYLRNFIDNILQLRLHNKLWHSRLFSAVINKSFGKEIKDFTKTMVKEGDAYTFFKTASLLLRYNEPTQFKYDSYVLVLNFANDVLNAPMTLEHFGRHLRGDQLTVVHTDISHSAQEYAYFKKTISEHEVETMMMGVS